MRQIQPSDGVAGRSCVYKGGGVGGRVDLTAGDRGKGTIRPTFTRSQIIHSSAGE